MGIQINVSLPVTAQDVAIAQEHLSALMEVVKVTTTKAAAALDPKKEKSTAKARVEKAFEAKEEEVSADDALGLGEEEEVQEEEKEIFYADVVKAFQAYAKDPGLKEAQAILKKLKVKAVKDIKKEDYKKVMQMLGA